MRLRFLLVAFVVICANFNANSQLLQWNTFGNAGTETTEPSVFNNANIAAANLTFGAGVTPAGNSNRFGGSGWNTGTAANAVSANDYIQFIVSPSVGFTFTATSLVFNWESSGTGPLSVTLRSSADGYASDLGTATVTTSLTTGNTITISGLTNITTSTTFRLYGHAAGAAAGTGGFDATASGVNVQLNGTTTSVGPYTIASGSWSDPAIWSTTLVPANTDNATITAGHVVYTNASLTRTGTTTVNGTFQLDNGGYATGTNFTYGAAGTLNFNKSGSSYSVAGSDVFWPSSNSPYNVNVLQGGLDMNSMTRTVSGIFSTKAGVTLTSSTLNISGTCRIDVGGFFSNVSPTYATGSTLIYNTGTVYNRQLEWTSNGPAAGSGTPYNVQLSNNTTLNYINGSNSGAKTVANHLTVDSGSSFYMDYGAASAGGALTVGNNLTNNGNFTLGFAAGDDLKLGGDLTNSGTFNGNSRAVYFTKASGTQTVTSSSPLILPYIVFSNTGNRTVKLATGTNLTVSSPSAGIAITFGSASDIFDINGNTLTIGTASVGNTISGSGTFKGSTTSNLTLLGTGSVGTLNFTAGSQNLGTLTIDRSAAAVGCVMGTAVTINTAPGGLTLTNGLIDLAGTTMTLMSGVTATGSANSFVISDVTAAGILRRNVTTTGLTYQFPIGDKTGTIEYSPATVTFTSGVGASNYLGVSVQDFALANGKHPNLDATTDYISRYWSITTSGTFTTPNYTFAASYLVSDVNGAETNCHSTQWDGTQWIDGTPGGTNTLSMTCTTVPATNHITKGYRNADINIKETSTSIVYLTGSTYNFGSQFTGSTTDITFTIQNLGFQPLTFTSATVAGSTYSFNPSFTLTPNISGPSGSRTFTIRYAPIAAGTFTGSVTFVTNDPDETSYVINFTATAIVPTPEMNVKGLTGGTGNIADGSTSAVFSNNTLFSSTALGSSSTKDFKIENTGSAILTLTGASPYVTITGANAGDFSVTNNPSSSIAATSGTTSFIITFTPTAAGTRTATVSIANNDSDENPYDFVIQGTGTCAAATNVLTPASGPAGTVVTITASANNLSGATVTLNGVSVAVTPISSTVIKVTVPTGAASGALVTTNSQGCTASNTFTVINNATTSCEGGNTANDLFISEVTDSNYGGLTYVEIYNGTGAAIPNLSAYNLQLASNGSASYSSLPLSAVPLAAGATYTMALGDDNLCTTTGGDGNLAAQVSVAFGVNFDAYQTTPTLKGNDHYALFKGATKIDVWGTYLDPSWAPASIGTEGATFRRKNTATVPNTTYSNSDWNIVDFAGSGSSACANNDYSDIGTYNFIAGTPPTITTQPSYTPSCKSTTLTVAATEGYAGSNPLAYQWYSAAPGSATWTPLANNATYSNVTAASLTIASTAGLDGYQYYCQVRENTATCYTASNAVQVTEALTVTWNGTSWSPSAPTSGNIVIINGNYNTAANGSFEACSVVVNSGSTLIISASNYVSIQNDLTVSAGATLQILNQGSLVMIDNNGVVTNNGTTNIIRTTSAYNRYDYTYWSSPVAAANLGSTFPLWRTDYSFSFTTGNYADVVSPFDGFDDDGNAWTYAGPGATMIPGKGYAVMAPTTGTFPTTSTVTFAGKVNNGIINLPMTLSANGASNIDDFNLIGNPYPSAIYANDFINANPAISGTLYFWTHRTGISNTNPGPDANNFITVDYAMYNLSGGTSSGTGSPAPLGYIASGQGFFVEANSATNAVFNNSMRNKSYSNAQFYRTANPESPADSSVKDRLWLNLQNADGLFSQQLLAYFDETTLGYDRAYDGVVSQTSNTVSFYSFIAGDKYRIQARPTFTTDDIVPLGYSSTMQGTFTIAIDHLEGNLADDTTPVYLEDKLLGIVHDLKQSSYNFTTAVGTFNERFVLRYTNSSLGTVDLDNVRDNVVIASSNSQIMIKSYTEPISEIVVFDVLGRQVYSNNKVNASQFAISEVSKNQQALIVKVKLENGVVVSNKIVF